MGFDKAKSRGCVYTRASLIKNLRMKYKVSKYMDGIRLAKKPYHDDIFVFFETYDDAKTFIIKRAESRLVYLNKEIKNLERKLPKLMALKEKE